MTGKQYNNLARGTIANNEPENKESSVAVAKAIFDNCGVALPTGDCKKILKGLMTNEYMGWRLCTYLEAQQAANSGVAAIGINDNRIVVITPDAQDVLEESPATYSTVAQPATSMSNNDLTTMQFYAYTAAATDKNLLVRQTVWDYFSQYFTDVQVAGIMGNGYVESGWNPLRRSSGSSYWGLFQLNSTLSAQLNNLYSSAGLDMNKYGYNVSTYQGSGAETNIPLSDLQTILSVQLPFVYGCKPTGADWITPLQGASSTNDAAERFLVKFEGATSSIHDSSTEILFYTPYIGTYYQGAASRRSKAGDYYTEFA